MKWESPANAQVQALLEVFHDPVDGRRRCSSKLALKDGNHICWKTLSSVK